ncbi:MAG: hypothetical protein HOY71_50950 [Nonomuraea sp.]|nr:hypothetical protein [Nonomuraea sp.]
MNRVELAAQRAIPGAVSPEFKPLEHAQPTSPVLYTPIAAFATGYLAAKYVCTFWGGTQLAPEALADVPRLDNLGSDELAAARRAVLAR